jgi:hypothetical protein
MGSETNRNLTSTRNNKNEVRHQGDQMSFGK